MAKPTKEAHEGKLRRDLIEKILGWKFGHCGLVAEARVSTMRKALEDQPTEVLISMNKSAATAEIKREIETGRLAEWNGRKLRIRTVPCGE